MSKGFDDACAGNRELAVFTAEKSFRAELIVFSGQMDFRVAGMEKGTIKWFMELD